MHNTKKKVEGTMEKNTSRIINMAPKKKRVKKQNTENVPLAFVDESHDSLLSSLSVFLSPFVFLFLPPFFHSFFLSHKKV